MIQERVRAGLARAKDAGKRLGRPPLPQEKEDAIRAALADGLSIRKAAAKFHVNPSSVQSIKHPFGAGGGVIAN
jgi:DNA invertase Pin-like site-specific DNA recombinase